MKPRPLYLRRPCGSCCCFGLRIAVAPHPLSISDVLVVSVVAWELRIGSATLFPRVYCGVDPSLSAKTQLF